MDIVALCALPLITQNALAALFEIQPIIQHDKAALNVPPRSLRIDFTLVTRDYLLCRRQEEYGIRPIRLIEKRPKVLIQLWRSKERVLR